MSGSFSVGIYTKGGLNFASKLSSLGRSHVGSLLTREERSMLARDVLETFATHADLVCGVTYTNWQRSPPCCCSVQTSVFNQHWQQDQRSNEKLVLNKPQEVSVNIKYPLVVCILQHNGYIIPL